MKVFISCDIEGVATTTMWDETERSAKAHTQQMTEEVKAACEGAIAAGATYILVKDAHDSACNIDPAQLPECVEVVRGWSGDPLGMATGVDGSFAAALFIGYHSAAGRDGNPLSHTMSTDFLYTKLNGEKCSEFRLYSYACALMGVPTVFLSGDKMLCEDSAGLHPLLKMVTIKDGYGGMTKSISPKLACDLIRKNVELALKQNLSAALCHMPPKYSLELCYKEHKKATRMSFYPGFRKIDDNTIQMKCKSFMDILTAFQFVC